MILVTHNVPFEVAFRVKPGYVMDSRTRTALAIVCMEIDGRKFNYSRMEFEDE